MNQLYNGVFVHQSIRGLVMLSLFSLLRAAYGRLSGLGLSITVAYRLMCARTNPQAHVPTRTRAFRHARARTDTHARVPTRTRA